ncbi:MAG: L-lactate dehydrogenase [Saccharofermentans sp.]|nr:L-lactate dehydrogenase [Saccharofermentans sp.]
MYKQEGTKVAIIGAGAVGSTTAFAIAMQQLCSELVLIDVNKEKALGEALDISHGLPFIGDMYIHAGDYSDVKDADCIIVTAGIPRKEGETRLDLAKKNVRLAHTITDSIMEHYNKGVIMVISNPCDLVTYKVAEWSGLPSNMIIGSGTNLDSARFRVLISRKLGVDVRNVHGYILGEHGETQFPAWSHTHVAGMSIDEYAEAVGIPFGPEVKDEIAQKTKSSGAEIIKLKGATFNGIAVSAATLLRSITEDEHTIRTVATRLNGEYGISGVTLDVPALIGANGVDKIIDMRLTDEEYELLKKSEANMREAIASVEDL